MLTRILGLNGQTLEKARNGQLRDISLFHSQSQRIRKRGWPVCPRQVPSQKINRLNFLLQRKQPINNLRRNIKVKLSVVYYVKYVVIMKLVNTRWLA
jgi:hypothetical protein